MSGDGISNTLDIVVFLFTGTLCPVPARCLSRGDVFLRYPVLPRDLSTPWWIVLSSTINVLQLDEN